AIGLAGAGRYSLDHATGHTFDQRWMLALAFATSAIAAAAVVTRRAQTQPDTSPKQD
ncbi:RpiR family transcriptional regulator, partial [Streptomyces sp. NPDC054932]